MASRLEIIGASNIYIYIFGYGQNKKSEIGYAQNKARTHENSGTNLY